MKLMNAFALIIFLLGPQTSYANGKTDIVILNNGDRITGEIKNLEAGILQLNTDTMGMVNIEWRFISELISDKSHSVETTDGTRWLGRLQKPKEAEQIVVNTVGGPVDLPPNEVVSVWPVAATFLDKMNLDVGLGFNYAKATEITNFDLSVDYRLRSDERLTEATLRSDITQQRSGNDQSRQEIRFAHQYLRYDQKTRIWLAGLVSNDALGVDLRLYGGGGIGKYFIKTNNKWFSVSGGLIATQENPEDGNTETNLEALGSVRYRYFRYASPEREFDTNFTLIPSLTDIGRIRSDLRTNFKLRFFKNMFWSLELYATYDNQPLSADAEKSDYGIISSLGWSN